MKNVLIASFAVMLSTGAWAQATPIGLWKTIDDETKQEKSLVRVSESGGVLTGKVEKILNPAKQDSRCDQCTGARKDQPVLGMTILSGVKQNAGEKDVWDGGEILDPTNGKTYKVRMSPVDGGKNLEVRGYVGMPLLGRTQTWNRVE